MFSLYRRQTTHINSCPDEGVCDNCNYTVFCRFLEDILFNSTELWLVRFNPCEIVGCYRFLESIPFRSASVVLLDILLGGILGAKDHGVNRSESRSLEAQAQGRWRNGDQWPGAMDLDSRFMHVARDSSLHCILVLLRGLQHFLSICSQSDCSIKLFWSPQTYSSNQYPKQSSCHHIQCCRNAIRLCIEVCSAHSQPHSTVFTCYKACHFIASCFYDTSTAQHQNIATTTHFPYSHPSHTHLIKSIRCNRYPGMSVLSDVVWISCVVNLLYVV